LSTSFSIETLAVLKRTPRIQVMAYSVHPSASFLRNS
jgi:hypothetical protein